MNLLLRLVSHLLIANLCNLDCAAPEAEKTKYFRVAQSCWMRFAVRRNFVQVQLLSVAMWCGFSSALDALQGHPDLSAAPRRLVGVLVRPPEVLHGLEGCAVRLRAQAQQDRLLLLERFRAQEAAFYLRKHGKRVSDQTS